MPAKFSKLGISFQYPENWTLDEDEAMAGHKSVTVVSPGGAFWTISIHPSPTDPTRLAEAAVQAMKDDYADLEAEPTVQSLAGREMIGYDMNFWYLDLTSSAAVRCLSTERATYAIFFQGEDREFDRIRSVFDAITTSLLQGLTQTGR